jgi:serine protease AprX
LGTTAIFFSLLVGAASAGISRSATKNNGAWVPSSLYNAALEHPDMMFSVIVRGVAGDSSASLATYFVKGSAKAKLRRQFYSIAGVAGSLSGADLIKLAANSHVLTITPDTRLASTDYNNQEAWRAETGVSSLYSQFASATASTPPAIAIVDSGVDSSKQQDFGTRIVASVNLSSLSPNATGDDEGHGTMVAGLAAGAGGYPGAAQTAPIVSIRTADANGRSMTSDVIAACDWILLNKDKYNIRVANFSLVGGTASSFRYDPLDKAVESLWFRGVTVVAAVGNYGSAGGPVSVQYSPGNDPFVISVGALDTNGTAVPSDDFRAPWSAYGHTPDGFAKPELSAPGRWLIAPVPMTSTLATTAPDRIMAPGYMWMSGTSLSAPVVSGTAAQILALHPSWTPDQVKGALMETAFALPSAGFAGGVGEVNAQRAVELSNAPNPNTNLDQYVKVDCTGAPYFDQAAWVAAMQNASTWSTTDWSATDWTATDWSATDWTATDWSATDWTATDWSATDWSATDWSATDWTASLWSP